MGAYENPETYIDTDSAKYIQNLQQDIAGAFAGYAQSYKSQQEALKKEQEENAKKLAAIQGEVENYALSLRTSLSETQAENKEVDLSATFEPLIQEAVKLRSGLLNNTIEDRQGAISKLAKINTAVTKFGTSLGEIKEYGTSLDSILNRPIGVEGGLDKAMAESDVRAIRIMQGKLKGRREAIFEDSDPDKLVWKVYDDQNKLVKQYAANRLDAFSAYGDGEYVNQIPDMSKSNQTLANTVNIFKHKVDNVGGKEVRESTGDITEEYLAKDANGKVKYTQVPIGNTGAYKMTADVDKQAVLNNPQLQVLLKSRIAGMSDNEIITYNNNILSTSVGSAVLGKKSLSPQEKEKFLEEYKQHWYKTQVNPKQDLKKPEGDVYIQEAAKPEKSTADKKPTEAEQSQSNFEKIVKEGGTIAGKGGLYLDVSIDENGVKRYYPYKIDAAGIRVPVEVRQGASNKEIIKSLAGQLGYTAKNL
jgi:hypothetical protein